MEAIEIVKNVVGPSWTVFVIVCTGYAILLYYKIGAIAESQKKASSESERMWMAINLKAENQNCIDYRKGIERRLDAVEEDMRRKIS